MKLAPPLSIRLSQEQKNRYETEAALLSQPLNSYIRNRLAISDIMSDEIQSLKQALSYTNEVLNNNVNNEHTASSDNHSLANNAVLLEMLMLLRQQGQAQNISLVQGELRRLGYPIWSSTTAERIK